MIFIYVTLNSISEAKSLAHKLLFLKMTNCTNIFPITAIYNFEDKITDEAEVVLIIKTKNELFTAIKDLIKEEIPYNNFVGKIKLEETNTFFQNWLNSVVK